MVQMVQRPLSVPGLWKGAHIMNLRSSQLSDFQLHLKFISPRSYLQCTYTCRHSLHHEERIWCHRDDKTTQTQKSCGAVQDWGFVSHSSVLAGGEMDICRWAAGREQSCPWSHLAIATGIGMNSPCSVQQSWGRSPHIKPISKGQTWCQIPQFSFPISVFFLRCCNISQSCQLEYARKP